MRLAFSWGRLAKVEHLMSSAAESNLPPSARASEAHSLLDLLGRLSSKRRAKPLSADEMDKLVEDAAVERFVAGKVSRGRP